MQFITDSFLGWDKIDMYRQLCEAVSSTAVNDVLRIDFVDREDFFMKYLYDFVRLIHKCTFHEKHQEIRAYRVSIELCKYACTKDVCVYYYSKMKGTKVLTLSACCSILCYSYVQ